MESILKRIWQVMAMFFMSTYFVWVAVIVAVIVSLIWGATVGIFTGFGIVLSVILYVWVRQLWWFISGTGDYNGRVGLLKSLWMWLSSKKND